MPNHVRNIIEFEDLGQMTWEQVKALLLKRVENTDEEDDEEEEFTVDFNILVPLDPILDKTIAGSVDSVVRAALADEDICQACRGGYFEHAEQRIRELPEFEGVTYNMNAIFAGIEAYDKTGFINWYEARYAKWGTKWNAYDCRLDNDFVIEFDTAWTIPVPWMTKLIDALPGVRFTYSWADEDLGYNCGRYTIENREIVDEYVPEERDIKFAAAILYGDSVNPAEVDCDENWEPIQYE